MWLTGMRRSRRALVVACVALVVLSAVFPLGGATLDWLGFTPSFVLLPPTSPVAISPEAARRHEQAAPLLSVIETRGPPASPHS